MATEEVAPRFADLDGWSLSSAMDAMWEGLVGFNATLRYVTTGKGDLVVISRSGEFIVSDQHGRERERHKVPYGALLSL